MTNPNTSSSQTFRPAGAPWFPALQRSAIDACYAAIVDVAESVAHLEVPGVDWGAAILLRNLSEHDGNSRFAEISRKLVDDNIDHLSSHTLRPGLYGGAAGVGWLCSQFDPSSGELAQYDYDDLDASLSGHCRELPAPLNYDLIGGVAGIALYFVNRLPDPVAVQALHDIQRALIAAAELTSPNSATWHTAPNLLPSWQRDLAPTGYFNLGLAHGVPGIVGMLTEIDCAGQSIPGAKELAIKAMTWTLSHVEQDGSLPSWISPGTPPRTHSRLTWCYGALGVSVAIALGARHFGATGLFDSAIALGRRSAERRDDGGVQDAGLCHGAAGNGHLLSRLFQATWDELFLDASRMWLGRALALRVPGAGIGGFRTWRAADATQQVAGWADDSCFLTGATGTALALLAAISPQDPSWDQVLLSRCR